MWQHLMWLTLSFVLCCLSVLVNRVDAAPVDSVDKAADYLERFGYLERGPQDSSYSESFSAESLSDAIRDFQSFAGLKKTGELDEATKELMNKPRCGVPDRIRSGSSSTRQKRFAIQGSHWPKKQLTYKIKKYTEDMPESDVDREIARAFQMWADVTDLAFVHVKNQSADVDIDILFASGEHNGEHGSCNRFDGPGHTLAHAAGPIDGGETHFDEGETWTLDSGQGTNLFQLATHEFGHSLGLGHTRHVKMAVMYPYYEYQPDFKLDKDDIEGIQELYGENQFSRKLALELKATFELLRTTVNNLEKKNIELRDDLSNTQIDLKKKLEETKQEWVETRQDLVKTVDDLSAKLNATTELLTTTVNNLVKTNTELRNLKSRADLSNTRIDLTDKLEGTKIDLEETKANFNNLSIKLNETKQDLLKTRADFLITVDDLSAKLNATEKELAETKITTRKLSTELKNYVANSDRLGQELKVAEENLKKDLRATSTELETTKTNLSLTRTELNSTKSAVADLATELNANSRRFGYELKTAEENLRKELGATSNVMETATKNLASTRKKLQRSVADLTTKLNARTSEIVDIGKMPTSCADLERMGHKLSGFFLVVNESKQKMEMIYCDFYPNQNDKQKWIGYADVKSAPVNFYAQRNSSFNKTSVPIPFDLAVVNEGNAMNLTSGKFTAPRPGIYFFSFTGVAHLRDSSYIGFSSRLYLNGNVIGSSFFHENRRAADKYSPVTLQSTLNLKKGDQVWVTIGYSGSSSSLFDDGGNHHTHFTGFMLDEDIVALL